MSTQDLFSEDLAQARECSVAACRMAGVPVQRHEHPLAAPDGSPLGTEVALFGPRGASRLLVLVSGVHGVETLPGSACQAGLAAGGLSRDLPAGTAVLLVHALNPWGAAHLRRNTEGNVDLCRNFMDFGQPLPQRPEYEALHAAVACPERRGPRRDEADARVAAFTREHGMEGFIQALMGGQFRHPDGFSYGGREPVWSHRTVRAILAEHASQARQVAIVEVHTGLGPHARGTLVTMHVDEALERARRWFGDGLQAPNQRVPGGPKSFYRTFGHSTDGYLAALPQAELTSVVLEFGTVPPRDSLPVMLDDHWLVHHGDVAGEEGRAIKQALLRAHYPLGPDWREAVLQRCGQVVQQALRGLAGG